MKSLQNSRVLITGCCGTIGRELVRHLLDETDVGEVLALDNNESDLFAVDQQYQETDRVHFALADIRDRLKIEDLSRGMDVIFHLAAYKHVLMCEHAPFDAVQTNIHGVQNVIQAAQRNKVGQVIFTSSDKAVNPTNVMGTSKLMGERLITAANTPLHGPGTIYASTRFGNVLGSRGSVVPIFIDQIRKGGPVTLTHPDMTRFIMSISNAAKLVCDSLFLAKGGEVFITKMPVLSIKDLAQAMIELLAPIFGHDPDSVEVSIIGHKAGEKMYEELMSHEETSRAMELENYFMVLPAFRELFKQIDYDYNGVDSSNVTRPYISSEEPRLSVEEIKSFLLENHLLDPPLLHCGIPS